MRYSQPKTAAAVLLIVIAICGTLRADIARLECLPFSVDKAVVDSEGLRMLAWQTTANGQLALIDVAKDSLIASTKIDKPITAIAFASDEPASENPGEIAALAVSEQEATLYIFDAKNLQILKQTEVQVSSNTRFLLDATLNFDNDSVRVETQGGSRLGFTYPDLRQLPLEAPQVPTKTVPPASEANPKPKYSKWQGFIHLGSPPDLGFQRGAPRHLQLTSRLFRPPEILDPDRFTSQIGIPHPTRTASISIQMATTSSKDATLVDLVAENAAREVLARWQIAELSEEQRKRNLMVTYSLHNNWVSLVLNGQVYIQAIDRIEQLAPPRFQFSLDDNVKVAHPSDSETIAVNVQGGFEPYAILLELIDHETDNPQTFIEPVAEDPYRYKVLLSSYIRHHLEALGEAIVDASDRTLPAEALMDQYAQSCSSQFQSIAGKELSHLPFAIPLVAVGNDAKGISRTRTMFYLVEIPRQHLLISVNQAVQRRWPGTSVAREAAARIIRPSQYTSISDFSSMLRSQAVIHAVSDTELDMLAEKALRLADTRWKAAWARAQDELKFPIRTWNAKTTEENQARFQGVFAGHAILQMPSKQRLFVLIESMSGADKKYVQSALADLKQPAGPRVAERVRFELLALAIEKFTDSHSHIPPPALVNEDGQPTLSWRVLLLPYVGASELYSLFRLDEPWDSPHNRSLLKYMPDIYRSPSEDGSGSRDSTGIVRILGERTASPISQVLPKDVLDTKNHNTLLAIWTKTEVPWSAPQDAELAALGVPDAMRWQTSRDGALTFGIMCDGSVQVISESSSSQAWSEAFLLANPGEELLQTW